MCMVRVYWNSWRYFLRKICTIFKSFPHLTKMFWNFSRKNIGSVVKTELYASIATFPRIFLTIYKCIKIFDLAQIIGFWEEGIQQDAKTMFDVIRETFWGKFFKKVLKFLKFFVAWAKNSSPFGRNCLTTLSKLISTCPEEQFEDFFPENIPKFQKFFGLWAEGFETFGRRFSQS